MIEFYECKGSSYDHLYLGEVLSGEGRGHLNLFPGRCGLRGKIVCPFRNEFLPTENGVHSQAHWEHESYVQKRPWAQFLVSIVLTTEDG